MLNVSAKDLLSNNLQALNCYEEYMCKFLLPCRLFGYTPSLKVSHGCYLATYVLNWICFKTDSTTFNVDPILLNADTGEFSTFKSLIDACLKGRIFSKFVMIKDIDENVLLQQNRWVVNLEYNPTVSEYLKSQIERFIESILRYALYSLYLTNIHIYVNQTKNMLISVQCLDSINIQSFVVNENNQLGLNLKTDEFIFDKSEARWYLYIENRDQDGQLKTTTCFISLILFFADILK